MPDTDRRGLQWLSGEYRSRDAYGGAIAETITRRGDEDAWINWQATRGHPSCSSTLSCGSHSRGEPTILIKGPDKYNYIF